MKKLRLDEKLADLTLVERLQVGAAYSLFKVIEGASYVIRETRHAIFHVTGINHQKVEDMRDSSFYYYIQKR